MNTRIVSGLLCSLIVLAGCSKTLNSSAIAIHDSDAESTIVGSAPQPSLTSGHDRAHWERVTLIQPHRTIEVEPDYIDDFAITGGTARARGRYPTVDTVLEEDRDHSARLVEGFISPVHALGGVLLMPFRMVLCQRWPGEVEMAPTTEYHRILPPPQTAEAMIMETNGE